MEKSVIEELLGQVKIQLDKIHRSSNNSVDLLAFRLEAEHFFSGEIEEEPDRLSALLFTEVDESPWEQAMYFRELIPKGGRMYPYGSEFFLQFLLDEIPDLVFERFQKAWHRPVSFLYSDCMMRLLNNRQQLFYLMPGTIQKVEEHLFKEDMLFTRYSETTEEIERIMFPGNKEAVTQWVRKQIDFLIKNKQEPDAVRSWGVKLVIDSQMKVYSLYDFEQLAQQPLADNRLKKMETIGELKESLTMALNKLWQGVQSCLGSPLKSEIVKA